MADAIIHQTETAQAGTLSAIVDGIDLLQTRLAHLSAMLEITYGAGFETFDNWSPTIRENFLWACSSLANECRDLSNKL